MKGLRKVFSSDLGKLKAFQYVLLSNPSRQHSEALNHWGARRRGKKGKHRNIAKKVVSFSSVSLFPSRKWEAVTKGGNYKDRPPDAEDNQGSQYHQMLGGKARRIKDTFT